MCVEFVISFIYQKRCGWVRSGRAKVGKKSVTMTKKNMRMSERKKKLIFSRAFLALLFFKFRQFPSRLSRRCRWLSFYLLRRTDDDDYDCLIHLSVDSNCNKNDVGTGVSISPVFLRLFCSLKADIGSVFHGDSSLHSSPSGYWSALIR